MGYTTKFVGEFILNRELDRETFDMLHNLANTRRVKRDISAIARLERISEQEALEKYGMEGELYFPDQASSLFKKWFNKRSKDETVLNENAPPAEQPSLWCGWVPTPDGKKIVWNEREKFHEAVKWIEYIIECILSPRGYEISGEMKCYGEEADDRWEIRITNNKVRAIY